MKKMDLFTIFLITLEPIVYKYIVFRLKNTMFDKKMFELIIVLGQVG